MSKPVYRIASIAGDGIGPEVITAGIQVLQKLTATIDTFELDFAHIEWGTAYYKKHGYYLPPDGFDQLRKFDAIFFGSVGAPGT